MRAMSRIIKQNDEIERRSYNYNKRGEKKSTIKKKRNLGEG